MENRTNTVTKDTPQNLLQIPTSEQHHPIEKGIDDMRSISDKSVSTISSTPFVQIEISTEVHALLVRSCSQGRNNGGLYNLDSFLTQLVHTWELANCEKQSLRSLGRSIGLPY